MEPGTIVMATLKDPRERIWGALREIKAEGITVEGIRAELLEDFIQQSGRREGFAPDFSTEFYSTHRMEKIAWDITDADLDFFARRFREKMGVTIEEYLNKRKG
ncbi:MAG: hypothetical protein KGM47_07710 [Acidobacteriota bacterium]|nr:hypothetical protein [Acidobacteriota bacterium]